MADYGLTLTGFNRPRLADIRALIVQDIERRLQRSIETRPDSELGQLIDTFSDREAALWEQLEAVYLAMYPSTASGVSLRQAASFTGVEALGALRSRGYVVMYGAIGTTVPAGSQIRNRSSSTVWSLVSDTSITAGSVSDVTISVATVGNNADYTVIVDGTEYTYTSGPSALRGQIITGLAQALLPLEYSVTSDETTIRIVTDGRAAFSLSVTSNIAIDEIGSPALFRSEEYGPVAGEVSDLSELVTRTAGLDRVENLQAVSLGRYEENDADLRARYDQGVFRLGAATIDSIGPRVQEQAAGISKIRVFQNNTDFVDEVGRPPHSVHVVAQGGLEDEIAEAIYRSVAGGVDTFGSITINVMDDDMSTTPISFDRQAPVYVWVRTRLTTLPPSEADFPGDGLSRVRSGILSASSVFDIGDDVVRERLYSGIYRTPGIAMATIELAWSREPEFVPSDADYSQSNIDIAAFEVAQFANSRIEVT